MVQKVTVTIFDDLDGSEAAETVEFGLDGVSYVIDLSEYNAARLRGEMRQFIDRARRVDNHGRAQKPRRRRSDFGSSSPGEQKLARQWAKEQGIQVAEIGRLSAEVMNQYREAKRAAAG